jgi:hypothetical protein
LDYTEDLVKFSLVRCGGVSTPLFSFQLLKISAMKQPLILNFNLAGIKLNYLPFLIFIITGIYSASAQSEKRGIAYGYHSPEDMEALSPDVTWWYNWSVTPESSVANVFQDYDFEFVPMAWNGNYNEAE